MKKILTVVVLSMLLSPGVSIAKWCPPEKPVDPAQVAPVENVNTNTSGSSSESNSRSRSNSSSRSTNTISVESNPVTTLENNNNITINVTGNSRTGGKPRQNNPPKPTNVCESNCFQNAVTRIDQNTTDVNAYRAEAKRLKRELSDAKSEYRGGVAAAAALYSLTPSRPGKTAVGLEAAHFQGETAFGLNVNHALESGAASLNFGVATTGEQTIFRLGVSVEL